MNRDEVLAKLQAVFDDVFVAEIIVSEDLTASGVPEWDSLTHIALVVAVEKAFGIRFRVGEVDSARNVGDLVGLIVERLKAKAG